jgi:hypothetical protein
MSVLKFRNSYQQIRSGHVFTYILDSPIRSGRTRSVVSSTVVLIFYFNVIVAL